MKAQEYCKDLLRNADYENYLTSLFTAQNKNKIWAIKAFNIETAIIRDRVSDVSVGKIKFAWWKECIKETFAVIFISYHHIIDFYINEMNIK